MVNTPYARTVSVLLAAGALLAGCIGAEGTGVGDNTCRASARYPEAIGCAYVYGIVTDTRGVRLDSINGLVRLDDACFCSMPAIDGDDNGAFSSTIYRLPRTGGFADTATGTVVVLASAPKYPRHVTGAAYFDTLRTVLRFARLGEVLPLTEVNLRIPLPGR